MMKSSMIAIVMAILLIIGVTVTPANANPIQQSASITQHEMPALADILVDPGDGKHYVPVGETFLYKIPTRGAKTIKIFLTGLTFNAVKQKEELIEGGRYRVKESTLQTLYLESVASADSTEQILTVPCSMTTIEGKMAIGVTIQTANQGPLTTQKWFEGVYPPRLKVTSVPEIPQEGDAVTITATTPDSLLYNGKSVTTTDGKFSDTFILNGSAIKEFVACNKAGVCSPVIPAKFSAGVKTVYVTEPRAPWVLLARNEYGHDTRADNINRWSNTFKSQLMIPLNEKFHLITGISVGSGDKNPFYLTCGLLNDPTRFGSTVIPTLGGSYTNEGFFIKLLFGVNLRAERILRMQDRPLNVELESGFTLPTPIGSAMFLTEMSSQLNNIKGSSTILFSPFKENKIATIRLGGGIYYSASYDYKFFDGGPAITGNFLDDLIQMKVVYLPNSGQLMLQGTIKLSLPKAEN